MWDTAAAGVISTIRVYNICPSQCSHHGHSHSEPKVSVSSAATKLNVTTMSVLFSRCFWKTGWSTDSVRGARELSTGSVVTACPDARPRKYCNDKFSQMGRGERDRQTDRQTVRQTDRQTEIELENFNTTRIVGLGPFRPI